MQTIHMQEKSSPDTLLRHWETLRLIPRAPQKISVTALLDRLAAAGYSISRRTVERDLVKLSAVWPLCADEAKPQGWSWQKDSPLLELPALDMRTALTLRLVEEHLRPLLPAGTREDLEPWFGEARKVLDAQAGGNDVARWPDKIRVLPQGLSLQPPTICSEAQAVIYDALLRERQVKIRYLARGDDVEKERVIHPLALVVRHDVSYLLCTFWGYQDVRQLVLHRIRHAQLLDEPACRPEGFDVDAYIAQGEFGYVQGEPLALVVEFYGGAAHHLQERPLASDQVLERLDEDTVQLRATVQNTAELRWWLLSLGENVQVREPAALRAEFAGVVRSLRAYYEP